MRRSFIRSLRLQAANLLFFGAGALGLGLFCGCAEEKTEAPIVLARIGESVITAEEFIAEVDRRMIAMRPMADRETVLKEMIERKAMLQRALAAGLQNDPEIRREMDNLLIGKLRERQLTPQLDAIEVSEGELKEAYRQNLSQYTRGAKVRLAIVKIEMHGGMSIERQGEAYERIMAAREKALKMDLPVRGAASTIGFGRVALDFSDDQTTRYRGGDLGWLDPHESNYRCPPEVLRTGNALTPGEVSDPIKTENGIYLVMKTDVREAVVTPFATAALTLRPQTVSAKRRETAEIFTEQALQEAGFEIDHQALASVSLPPAARRLMVPRDELQPPAMPGVNLSADAD